MKGNLEKYLQKYFQYESFRPGQKEIIELVLEGEDVLGILPTGSGKSICYQLPSLLFDGLTVVVSPLISLMIDQVRETKAFHIKAVAALHSMQTMDERMQILQNLHRYKIIYLSPELIRNPVVLNYLKKTTVSLFVIDEAHCISQWGYDFRPDYLRLSETIRYLQNPPILALSGTVTRQVKADILKELSRPNMNLVQQASDRKNIRLVVERLAYSDSKEERLLKWLRTYQVPTIIYFSSRKKAEEVSRFLSGRLTDQAIAYYHGGLDQQARLQIQQQFIYDQIQVICATSAFGMGINKANVKLIIHYHLPTEKESFIQEIGRAGRNGQASLSIVLYKKDDEILPLRLIESELPSEAEIRKVFNYLYVQTAKGKQHEKDLVRLAQILEIDQTKLGLIQAQLEIEGFHLEGDPPYHYDRWKRNMERIITFFHKRKQVKQQNFQRMFAYIETTSCLRENLYQEFQETGEEAPKDCCSNCGLQVDQLQLSKPVKKQEDYHDWKAALANLLRIREANE